MKSTTIGNVKFDIKKENDELVVRTTINNKRIEERCYYTDDIEDAIETMKHMTDEEIKNQSENDNLSRIETESVKGNSPECPNCGNWNALLDSSIFIEQIDSYIKTFKCRDCDFEKPKNEMIIKLKEIDKPGMGDATTYHFVRMIKGEEY